MSRAIKKKVNESDNYVQLRRLLLEAMINNEIDDVRYILHYNPDHNTKKVNYIFNGQEYETLFNLKVTNSIICYLQYNMSYFEECQQYPQFDKIIKQFFKYACKVSSYELIHIILTSTLVESRKFKLINYCLDYDSLDMLKYLYKNRITFDKTHYKTAVEQNAVKCLEWMTQYAHEFYEIDNRLAEIAIENEAYECLHIIIKNSVFVINVKSVICLLIQVMTEINEFTYLISYIEEHRKVEWCNVFINNAIVYNKLDILRFLFTKGLTIVPEQLVLCFRNPFIATIEFVMEKLKIKELDAKFIHLIIQTDLNVFKYLGERGVFKNLTSLETFEYLYSIQNNKFIIDEFLDHFYINKQWWISLFVFKQDTLDLHQAVMAEVDMYKHSLKQIGREVLESVDEINEKMIINIVESYID